MSLVTLEFYDREFNQISSLPDVEFRPNSYKVSAIGGPRTASITFFGNALELWDCMQMLRYWVVFRNENAKAVWYGFIESVSVRAGKLESKASLKDMFNQVKVKYSYTPSGMITSLAGETTWFADPTSQNKYGIKEQLISLSRMPPSAAEQAAQTQLALVRFPSMISGLSGAEESLSGTFELIGAYNTLEWQYFAQAKGLESYEATGTGTADVGKDSAHQQLYQTLQVSEPWYADSIHVRVRRAGEPTDNLIIALVLDAGGSPGTVIEDFIIAGDALPTQYEWVRFELATANLVSVGTVYGIHIYRSGALDATNHYTVDSNDAAGYVDGAAYVYDGTWDLAAFDILFKLAGVMETSQQMAEMIIDSGQFFTGSEIETASALYTNPFRKGDHTTIEELQALMSLGGSDSIPYLCNVDENRKLRLYKMPQSDTIAYYWTVRNELIDENGNQAIKTECPCAMWIELREIIPDGTIFSTFDIVDKLFVEEASYDCQADTNEFTFLNERGIKDIGRIQQG